MAFSNGNGGGRRMMAEINVTPLVDVMLVLLIIFMVTAPMLTQGVDVNLPQANAKALKAEEERLVITVDANSRIFIGEQPVEFNRMSRALKAIVERRQDRQVFFRADRAVPYGFVVKVIAEVRNAGIEKLGMVTEPLER
ncbi:MAG: protein TolR [Deltaproteobacteria bacterium GWC2_65_14]|nr:MAG: protein TolR [Deltaproteobacteria bacterium GWC2_65_14]